jgi:imidazolonepropionase-like amidohydrolase
VGARSALILPTASGAARVLDPDAGPCASLMDEASMPDRAPTSVAAQAALIASVLRSSDAGARAGETTPAARATAASSGLRVRFDDAGSIRLARDLARGGGSIVGLPATEQALSEALAGSEAPLLCLSALGPTASLEQVRLAALAAVEIPFVLGTGGARAGPVSLRWAAASLVARGVPEDRVLSALTRDAAAAAGAELRGVIEPGAIADLVLWSASPLSPASRVLKSWVSGEEVHSHD